MQVQSAGGARGRTLAPPPLWVHSGSGALRCLPPPPTDTLREKAVESALGRRAEYSRFLSGEEGQEGGEGGLFKRGKRSNGQRVWRRERGKREAVVELPLGARTVCGWWHSTASGLWMHAGSGTTADAPPPLSKAEADKLIRAHLRAMEAAEAL